MVYLNDFNKAYNYSKFTWTIWMDFEQCAYYNVENQKSGKFMLLLHSLSEWQRN